MSDAEQAAALLAAREAAGHASMASQGLSALRAKGPVAVAAFATQHKLSAGERAKLEAAVESGSTDGLAPKTLGALESEGGEPGWGAG